MKKHSIILAAAAAALVALASSCNKEVSTPVVLAEDEGNITVTVGREASTKAGTTASNSEKTLNSLTFFVFNHDGGSQDGNLDIVKRATEAELATFNVSYSGSWVIEKVKTGTKTLAVVGNLPYDRISGILTLADLNGIAVKLEDNDCKDTGHSGSVNNFLMYKTVDVTVTAGTDPAPSVVLDRLISRVTLVKFDNDLPPVYGTVKLKSIVLANVRGDDNLSHSKVQDTWYNKLGCNGPSYGAATVIGNGSVAAEVPAMTFASIDTNCPLGGDGLAPMRSVYGFRNDVTALPNKLSQGWAASGSASMLNVIVTIEGVDYWYPVPLTGKLEPNYDYAVSLKIIGLGNRPDDPEFGTPITKENATATVTVSNWTTGNPYSETI